MCSLKNPIDFVRNLLDQHPKLPVWVANSLVSKVIQLVKDNVIDPTFANSAVAAKIRSSPALVKTLAEWIPYVLSGTVRTFAKQNSPVSILFEEALAESFNLIGIRFKELSSTDQAMIIDVVGSQAIPEIRREIVEQVAKEGPGFWRQVMRLTGTVQDWENLLGQADGVLDKFQQSIQARRVARKARGVRRFLL